MSMPLSDKIEQLKARYQGEACLPPHEALAIIETLRMMLEVEQSRVTAIIQAQCRLDMRIHALERLAATYKEVR